MLRTSCLPSSMATLLTAMKVTIWVLIGNHFQPVLHYAMHVSHIFILHLVCSSSSPLFFHFIISIIIVMNTVHMYTIVDLNHPIFKLYVNRSCFRGKIKLFLLL